MDISDRVIKIIAEQAVLDPSDVTLESSLEDLGIDSLGLVESIFAIEEEFDMKQLNAFSNDSLQNPGRRSNLKMVINKIGKLSIWA